MLILGLRHFLKDLNNQIQIPCAYRKAEHDGKAIQNQILETLILRFQIKLRVYFQPLKSANKYLKPKKT